MNKAAILLLNFVALGLAAQVAPNEHLKADGLPAIPAELGAKVARYTNVRTAGLADWHPARREVLISTRFGDSSQLHAVAAPMGMRRQMTFQADPVSGLWGPDGKCLLTTEGDMDQAELRALAQAWDAWRNKANDIMVIGNARIVTVMDIKLEMPSRES